MKNPSNRFDFRYSPLHLICLVNYMNEDLNLIEKIGSKTEGVLTLVFPKVIDLHSSVDFEEDLHYKGFRKVEHFPHIDVNDPQAVFSEVYSLVSNMNKSSIVGLYHGTAPVLETVYAIKAIEQWWKIKNPQTKKGIFRRAYYFGFDQEFQQIIYHNSGSAF